MGQGKNISGTLLFSGWGIEGVIPEDRTLTEPDYPVPVHYIKKYADANCMLYPVYACENSLTEWVKACRLGIVVTMRKTIYLRAHDH